MLHTYKLHKLTAAFVSFESIDSYFSDVGHCQVPAPSTLHGDVRCPGPPSTPQL